ncbi:MAG: glutathione S-transferase N-terminal domain-containing protein [Dokdonella sp.]|nr:glutathione S-transferase N-terminal domain-containing protein [Dokdonella sp.]
MMTLHGRPGWGSALIEAQLLRYGLPFRFEEVGDLFASAEARAALAAVNPLAQVPTLVLDDGRVMSESAAITLYLADLTGRDDLVPGPQSPERAAFLRWLVFLVANLYPTFTYADDPQRFVADAAAPRRSGRAWTPMRCRCGASSRARRPHHGSSASDSARSICTSRS